MMQYRPLGKTGLKISAISFGCNQVGASWYGYKDESAAAGSIRRSVDLGINLFDTAITYARGNSEVVLGRALKGLRSKVLVATKGGALGRGRMDGSARNLSASLDESLRRLDTDYVDIYYLHHPDPATPVEVSMSAIKSLIKSGKARFAGICNASLEDLQGLVKAGLVDAAQYRLNMFQRENSGIVEYCSGAGLGFLAYSPMAFGLLAGKTLRKPMKEPVFLDTRFWNPHYPAILRLREFAENRGISLPALSLAWGLKFNAVTSAIIGTSSFSQVEDDLKGLDISLEAADWLEVEDIVSNSDHTLKYARKAVWSIRDSILKAQRAIKQIKR